MANNEVTFMVKIDPEIKALLDWRGICLKILRLYHDDGEHFTVYPSPLSVLAEEEKLLVLKSLKEDNP